MISGRPLVFGKFSQGFQNLFQFIESTSFFKPFLVVNLFYIRKVSFDRFKLI